MATGIRGEDEVRRVLPGFDIFHLGDVHRLLLEPGLGAGTEARLVVEAESCSKGERWLVTVAFHGVEALNLPRDTTYLSFGECVVTPLSGYERLRFGVTCHLGGTSFYCREIALARVVTLDASDARDVVWQDAEALPASGW